MEVNDYGLFSGNFKSRPVGISRPDGKASEGQLSAGDDSVVDGLRSLAKVIHQNGSKTVMQINHAGSATTREITGSVPVGPSDFRPGGKTIEDSIIAAKEFEKAGVNILDISGGFSGYTVPGLTDQGFFSPLTEAIKGAVSIPVILTGGITEAEAAEKLLKENKVDLIGGGRAISKDSNWAKIAITSLQAN